MLIAKSKDFCPLKFPPSVPSGLVFARLPGLVILCTTWYSKEGKFPASRFTPVTSIVSLFVGYPYLANLLVPPSAYIFLIFLYFASLVL